jgi:hypothetical protein
MIQTPLGVKVCPARRAKFALPYPWQVFFTIKAESADPAQIFFQEPGKFFINLTGGLL